jgi:hypothetical protein
LPAPEAYIEAEPLLRELVAGPEKNSPGQRSTYYREALLGASLAGQKRYEEAETLLSAEQQGLHDRLATSRAKAVTC